MFNMQAVQTLLAAGRQWTQSTVTLVCMCRVLTRKEWKSIIFYNQGCTFGGGGEGPPPPLLNLRPP